MKNNIKLFSLFLFLALVDQILKYFSNSAFCNKNLAWSIPIPTGIVYVVWVVIIAVLVYIFFKTKKYYSQTFLILIFAGAVSNLIDRIRLGCVVDYIDLSFFPVFNLADTYITIGILFFILNITRNKNTKY